MAILLSIFGVATIFALGYALGHQRGRAAEKRAIADGPDLSKKYLDGLKKRFGR